MLGWLSDKLDLLDHRCAYVEVMASSLEDKMKRVGGRVLTEEEVREIVRELDLTLDSSDSEGSGDWHGKMDKELMEWCRKKNDWRAVSQSSPPSTPHTNSTPTRGPGQAV